MKNNIDFIYEYSDLNFLKTRVMVLTGDYSGTILEFGGSAIGGYDDEKDKKMIFEYTLYKLPDNHDSKQKLRGNQKFEKFLSELLLDIIECRHLDKNETNKAHQALSGTNKSNIKINKNFYLKN
jgi:hypothetical protein